MMATRRLSPGRRNLLERLAHSRAARDLREAGRQAWAGIVMGVLFIGWCVVTVWLIEIVAPALARWLGWM